MRPLARLTAGTTVLVPFLLVLDDVRLTFDRGTILLAEPAADLNPRHLPGVVWDHRIGGWRAPGYRYADLRRKLLQWRQSFEDHVAYEPARIYEMGRPADPQPAQATGSDPWSQVDLRPYQAAALACWEMSGRHGTLVLPTGSGKTRLALAAMAAIRRVPHCGIEDTEATGRGSEALEAGGTQGISGHCLCLVPTRVLLTQWQAEISKVYRGSVGIWGDGARELAPVTVMTFESAYRQMSSLGNHFAFLIVDEAHHFGHGPHDEAIELCIAPFRLGLTATPPLAAARRERLEQLIGPVVYELTVGDLAGLFLAPIDVMTLSVSFDVADQHRYDHEVSRFRPFFRSFFARVPEARWEDLCREARRSEAGRLALASWRRARRLAAFHSAKAEMVHRLLERHRQNKVLVFTGSNQATYALARSELIMPITCDIGRHERREALDLFGSGQLTTLVSAQVLNEGIDIPDAEVAIILGTTGADREHIQRVGRLLRPSPGKRATVYDIATRRTSEVEWAGRRRNLLTRRTGPWGSAPQERTRRP